MSSLVFLQGECGTTLTWFGSNVASLWSGWVAFDTSLWVEAVDAEFGGSSVAVLASRSFGTTDWTWGIEPVLLVDAT